MSRLLFERLPSQRDAKLSGQSLDIDVLVDDALFVEQIVPAKPPTLLLSAVGNTQVQAFIQQSPPKALNDGLLRDANLHAGLKMVWP